MRTKPATGGRRIVLVTCFIFPLTDRDPERRHDEEVAPLHPDQEERAGDLAGESHHRVDNCRHMLQNKTCHVHCYVS